MDHNCFDRLSQTLADTRFQSRRGVLAALGIAVLGALAGVDPEAASAKRKSRRRAKRKTRHESKPRQKDARGRLRAASSTGQPNYELDTHCKFSKEGDPCQEASCTDETTLQPACTCDRQGHCICPPAVTCPNHLVCLREKAVCLNECSDDFDCAPGATCGANGTCTLDFGTPKSDCVDVNLCSGNGRCADDGTCVCDEGWTGATCSERPQVSCSDHLTCEECNADIIRSCVFCNLTLDGQTGVCRTLEQCEFFQDICP